MRWFCGVKIDPSSGEPKNGSPVKVRDACKTRRNGAPREVALTASDLGVDLAGLPTVAQVDQNAAGVAANAATAAAVAAAVWTVAANLAVLEGESITCASQVGADVFFDGCNVHVRSGLGASDEPSNGLGNLIVGYDEGSADNKTGSHNLIVGMGHSYTSRGSLVAGEDNTTSGDFSSVLGGQGNAATGRRSSVLGGQGNTAGGDESSVSGGAENEAPGYQASVSGGTNNTASGDYSSVSGGLQNTAEGSSASVSGGSQNKARGRHSSVSGGGGELGDDELGFKGNLAIGENSWIGGGNSHVAFGPRSSIAGGFFNQTGDAPDCVFDPAAETDPDESCGIYSSILGGHESKATGFNSSVSGGWKSHASGPYSSVLGGQLEHMAGAYGTIPD